jgi:hypothetical protein
VYRRAGPRFLIAVVAGGLGEVVGLPLEQVEAAAAAMPESVTGGVKSYCAVPETDPIEA